MVVKLQFQINDSSDSIGNLYDFSDLPQWAVTTVMTYLVFVFALGVTGNSLLTCVQFKNKKKSSTDVMILTMAINDLTCSLIYVPILWIRKIDSMWQLVESNTLCNLLPSMASYFTLASVLLLVAIAIDRYLKTCRPHSLFFSKERAKRVCVSLVLLDIGLTVPSFLAYTFDKHSMRCKVTNQFTGIINKYNVFLAILTISALLIMIFTYRKVGLAIRKRHRHPVSTHRIGKKVSKRNKFLNCHFLSQKSKVLPKTSIQKQDCIVCRSEATAKLSLSAPHKLEFKPGNVEDFAKQNIKPVDKIMTYGVKGIPSDDFKTLPMEIGELQIKVKISEQQVGPAFKRNSNENTNAENVCECSGSCKQALNLTQQKRLQEEKNANRITLILFLTTIVYFLTFVLQWLLIMSAYSLFGVVARYFSLTTCLINVVAKPFFIFSLNSRSREELRQLSICKRTHH